MNPLKWFRRRDDEEAAAESVNKAGGVFRSHPVVSAAAARWNLTDEQRAFLVRLLEQLGPMFLLLLKVFLKV